MSNTKLFYQREQIAEDFGNAAALGGRLIMQHMQVR